MDRRVNAKECQMPYTLPSDTDSLPLPKRTYPGFTLVELLVISPFVVLLIGAFVALAISLTGEVLVSQARNNVVFSHQDTLERIRDDVEHSTNFLPESDIAITSPQGYNDNTQNFSNVSALGDMLVLKKKLTTKGPFAEDNQTIFVKNAPNICSSATVTSNLPMYGVVVYFVKNDTLWRRTILPSNYESNGCATPWQLPSCSPSYTNPYCKTNDVELLTGISVDGFSIKYFTQANSTSEDENSSNASLSAAVRKSALDLTNTVEVNLSSTRKVAGKDISYSSYGRSTKLD